MVLLKSALAPLAVLPEAVGVTEERASPGGSIVVAECAVVLQGRLPGGRVSVPGATLEHRLKTGGGVIIA